MSTSTCDANLRNPGATAKKCLRLRHLTPFSYISWIFFRDLFVAALSFLLSLAARSLNIFHIFRSWWRSMTVKILSPWPFSISIYVKLCKYIYQWVVCGWAYQHHCQIIWDFKDLDVGTADIGSKGSPVSKSCFNQLLHPKFGLGSLRKLQQWLYWLLHSVQGYIMI